MSTSIARTAPRRAEHPPPEKDRSMRILVVDDDDDTRAALAPFLAEEGNVVEACDSATTALDRLRAAHYDVLLTDFVMPGMNGLELTSAATELDPTLRCLIMSGHLRVEGTPSDVAWVAKPIDIDELVAALRGQPR